ncbi:hypothetical protein H4582DRAFT_2031264 [Lactarius indigo]|nr:hypothetical protein H4582DRAFT_2031264 [Lactarius indigo]
MSEALKVRRWNSVPDCGVRCQLDRGSLTTSYTAIYYMVLAHQQLLNHNRCTLKRCPHLYHEEFFATYRVRAGWMVVADMYTYAECYQPIPFKFSSAFQRQTVGHSSLPSLPSYFLLFMCRTSKSFSSFRPDIFGCSVEYLASFLRVLPAVLSLPLRQGFVARGRLGCEDVSWCMISMRGACCRSPLYFHQFPSHPGILRWHLPHEQHAQHV